MAAYLKKIDEKILNLKIRGKHSIEKCLDAYLEKLYKWPSIFLLLGISFNIIILLPASYINPENFVSDAVDLISPSNSRSRLHQDQLIKAFPNMTVSKYFYHHQRILEGFDLSVIYLTKYIILNNTLQEDIKYIHDYLMNNVSVSDGNGVFTFQDLCVRRHDRCYVYGEFMLDETHDQASENIGELYRMLSDIKFLSEKNNGTQLFYKAYKLRYYLRYENNKKRLSTRWIKSSIDQLYRYDVDVLSHLKSCVTCSRNISVFMTSKLDRDLVYIDLNDNDCFMKLPISFPFSVAILLFVFWILGIAVAVIIIIASWSIMSYIGYRMVSMSLFAVIFILVESATMLITSLTNSKKEMKDGLPETLSTIAYLLVFAIGISSEFYIVRFTSIAVCLSTSLLILMYVTIVSSIRVLEYKYVRNLVIHLCPSVKRILCFCGCHFGKSENNDEIQPQKKTLKNRITTLCGKEVSSEKNLGRIFVMKFLFSVLCFAAYLTVSIYGMWQSSVQPTLCDLADPDHVYSKYCQIDTAFYKQDFWVTLHIKHEPPLKFNEISREIIDYVNTVKSDKCIRNDTEINWMKVLQSNGNQYASYLDFIEKNEHFINDLTLRDNKTSVEMSRIYLRSAEWYYVEKIKECMLKLQDFEHNSPTEMFFYAPEFLLFEGYVSGTSDLMRITATATTLSLIFIFVTVQKSLVHILILIIIPSISSWVGVIGFMHLFGQPLTFYNAIPFLLVLSTVTLLSHSFKIISCLQWCVGLFTCGILILVFRNNDFILQAVFLPLILFSVSGLLHLIIFLPGLVHPWIKCEPDDESQDETNITDASEMDVSTLSESAASSSEQLSTTF